MDNQHRKITGYRELTKHEVSLMNEVKAEGQRIKDIIDRLEAYRIAQLDSGTESELTAEQIIESSRCLAIAQNQLQTGCMWLTRSIALPDSF